MLEIILTVLAMAIVVVLINRKFNPILLFFTLGIFLQLYLIIIMGASPMGEDTTGSSILDIFAYITSIFKSQMSGTGANIMLVAGFAALMNQIGASAKLADLMMKPLLKLNSPYIVVAGLFLVGVFLKLIITSHAGHGLLLMTVIYPILLRLGISRVSAASVIILSGAIDWGPNNSVVLHAAETVSGVPVGEFLVSYQFLPGLLSALAMAAVIAVYFKYTDAKEVTDPTDLSLSGDESNRKELDEKVAALPEYYAVLPTIPLILIIVFTLTPNISLDVFSANFIGIFVTIIIEFIRVNKDRLDNIAGHLSTVWKTMGNSFANIVVLIIAATFFANSLLALGGIEILTEFLTGFESAGFLTVFALSLLILLTVVALGSGVASWFAFGPLLVDIAPKVGVNIQTLAVPVQLSSGLGRAISPVAAAGLSVAGLAGVDIPQTIRRSALPLMVGWLVTVLVSYILL